MREALPKDWDFATVRGRNDDGHYVAQVHGRSEDVLCNCMEGPDVSAGDMVMILRRPHEQLSQILRRNPWAVTPFAQLVPSTQPDGSSWTTSTISDFASAVSSAYSAGMPPVLGQTQTETPAAMGNTTNAIGVTSPTYSITYPPVNLEVFVRELSRPYTILSLTIFQLDPQDAPLPGDSFYCTYDILPFYAPGSAAPLTYMVELGPVSM